MSLNPQPVDYFNDLTTLGDPSTGWTYLNGATIDSPGRDHNSTCLLCPFSYPSPGQAIYTAGTYNTDVLVGFAFRYSRAGVGDNTPNATLYFGRYEAFDVTTDVFYVQLQPDSTIAFFTSTGLYLAGPSQPIQQDTWYWLEFAVSLKEGAKVDPPTTIILVGIDDFALQGISYGGGPLQPFYYVTPPGSLSIANWYNVHGLQAGIHDVRFQDLFLDFSYVPEVPTRPDYYGDSKLGECPPPP